LAEGVMAGSEIAERLIEWLRRELEAPALAFAERPSRLSGGFDTEIFAFRLTGGPASFSMPLILRLFDPRQRTDRGLRERVTQNTVAELGFPAPRVLLAIADSAGLGGAALVMERVPGRPLLEAGLVGMSRLLAGLHLRLHALDAGALRRALEAEGRAAGIAALVRDTTLEGAVAALEQRIESDGLSGLGPAIEWIARHRPPSTTTAVICHGDFHPQNILVSAGTVAGVIDWPNAIIADPALDVAATKVILELVPVDLAGLAAGARWLVRAARPIMVGRYLAGYRRRRPLDARGLAYGEALACLRGLVRADENRRRQGALPLNPLDASVFAERLAARFARITGISPALPSAKT